MNNDRFSGGKIILILFISLLGICILLVGFFFGCKLCYQEEIDYYEQKCQEFAEENADIEYVRAVFIGDEIIESYSLSDYFSNQYLCNRGIKNDITVGVLNRLQTSVYDTKPGSVIIMVGANDLKHSRSVNAIIKTYKEIVYSIFDNIPTTNIHVVSVIPQNKDYEKSGAFINVDSNMKKIRELNSKLEAFCDTCAASYLNLFDLLVDEDGYLSREYSDDGFHLNKNGYAKFTELLNKMIS